MIRSEILVKYFSLFQNYTNIFANDLQILDKYNENNVKIQYSIHFVKKARISCKYFKKLCR